MNTIVLNLGQDSWNMEFQEGAVMNGNTAEHIKEGAAVISEYADMIALRSFPTLTDKVNDYQEFVLKQFLKYVNVPVCKYGICYGTPFAIFDRFSYH
jgi:N-succinyl-L-ornithine transcarbamylase